MVDPCSIEAARLDALNACSILDTEPDPIYDDIAQLAASICDAPIALVSLVDGYRQWFKARIGVDISETPRSIAFCSHTIQSDEPFVVEDALKDPRFRDNPMVTGEAAIRFYAGVPIKVEGCHRVGALCVKDTRPRTLTESQMRALKTLAAQVSSQLDLRLSVRRLETAWAELVSAKLAAEASSRAKTLFLANMSHEIRTPLTAIVGFSDLLADKGFDPELHTESLETVRSSARHLLGLVNDILDLSQIDAGELKIVPHACDVRAIIDDAQRIVRPRAESKNVAFSVSVDRAIPRCCVADAVRVRQLILNLLDNAVKFTHAGKVQLNASYAEGDTLRIEVVDTGIGIEAEHLDHIFVPFEQADSSMTRKYGGTGLGLAIGRRLARAMGGDLVVSSSPGKGSCFTFTIRAPRASGGRGTGVRPLPFGGDRLNSLQGRRILLAEDGPDNQRLFTFILGRSGVDLEIVGDGAAAVGAAVEAERSGKPFDVIIMDMQMPVMDGYEATATLRGRGVLTPVLALTAHAMAGAKEECLAAGCTEYMSKPIERHELLAVCASLVANADPALTPRAG